MVYEQAYLDQDHGSQAMTVLCELWKKQTLCDATVQAGSYKIKVHKTVLMVASPTLLALCQNGPCEGHLQVQLPINLRGVDALHCFIMYLYEGLLNLNEESVMEVLNIASYLQVETVVKFCLSFLDSAKEQNVVLKAALSSPYDTCLYKVLNESLSKSSESITNKNSNWVYQPESTNIKTKIIHKPVSLSSSETSIVISERKDKSFYVENLNFKGNSLSSSQAGESSSSKNVSEASNEAVQIQYNIIDDEIKPNIAPQNSSTSENFVVQEISETYSFSQDNNHSSPSSDSHILKLKETNHKVDSKLHHSDLVHDKQSSPLLDQKGEDGQSIADYSYKISSSPEMSRQVRINTLDESDCNTEEVLSLELSGCDLLSSQIQPNLPSSVNLLECPTCKKTFSTKGNLKTHQRKHEGTLFKCPRCPRKFFSQSLLNEHLKIHDGKVYNCDHCGKEFFTRWGIRLHQMSHEGHYKMTCKICGRGFNSRSTFEAHQNMHEDNRPYRCEHCRKCFYNNRYLKKHLKICNSPLKKL